MWLGEDYPPRHIISTGQFCSYDYTSIIRCEMLLVSEKGKANRHKGTLFGVVGDIGILLGGRGEKF